MAGIWRYIRYAFLILAIIGALAYFDYINITNCSINGARCAEHTMTNTTLEISIRNTQPTTLHNVTLAIDNCGNKTFTTVKPNAYLGGKLLTFTCQPDGKRSITITHANGTINGTIRT